MSPCRQYLVVTVVSLIASGAVRAGEIPDGIYILHEKGDGPKVKRNDTGGFLTLGERLTIGSGPEPSTPFPMTTNCFAWISEAPVRFPRRRSAVRPPP